MSDLLGTIAKIGTLSDEFVRICMKEVEELKELPLSKESTEQIRSHMDAVLLEGKRIASEVDERKKQLSDTSAELPESNDLGSTSNSQIQIPMAAPKKNHTIPILVLPNSSGWWWASHYGGPSSIHVDDSGEKPPIYANCGTLVEKGEWIKAANPFRAQNSTNTENQS